MPLFLDVHAGGGDGQTFAKAGLAAEEALRLVALARLALDGALAADVALAALVPL